MGDLLVPINLMLVYFSRASSGGLPPAVLLADEASVSSEFFTFLQVLCPLPLCSC